MAATGSRNPPATVTSQNCWNAIIPASDADIFAKFCTHFRLKTSITSHNQTGADRKTKSDRRDDVINQYQCNICAVPWDTTANLYTLPHVRSIMRQMKQGTLWRNRGRRTRLWRHVIVCLYERYCGPVEAGGWCRIEIESAELRYLVTDGCYAHWVPLFRAQTFAYVSHVSATYYKSEHVLLHCRFTFQWVITLLISSAC